MKNVYLYDDLTSEYLGTEQAFLDPLETEIQGKEVFLLPANATFEAPLVVKEGYAQVFKDGVWNYVEDNRGNEYWLADDEYGTPARTMKELGAFPANAVFETPQKPFEMAKQEKLQEIDTHTAAKITGGFVSLASGDPVTYDSDKDTQLTMQGIALNVQTPLFAQEYPNGCPVRGYPIGADVKEIYMLNAEQILRWCADLSMHIGTCKQRGWELQAMVKACTTKEELEAIVL